MTTRRRDPESGTLSIFIALGAVALLMLSGMVLDAGGRLRSYEHADAVAQEAARAGGQQIDRAALLQSKGLRLDPVKAKAAALAYITANEGYATNIRITVNPTTITVAFDSRYRTVLLSIIGINTIGVGGIGQATLVPGVDKAAPATVN